MTNDSAKPFAVAPLNWGAVLKSGLLAGIVFLVIPLGSPWSSLNFGSGAVMGRAMTLNGTFQSLEKIVFHLAMAAVYTLVIAEVARMFRAWRGIVAGGVIGLVLYGINFGVVRIAAPEFIGMEGRVVFTHIAFGLLAAAFYKGFTRTGPEIRSEPGNPPA